MQVQYLYDTFNYNLFAYFLGGGTESGTARTLRRAGTGSAVI